MFLIQLNISDPVLQKLSMYEYIPEFVINVLAENDLQGILVFASVMATLGLQIIIESARVLLSNVSRNLPLIASVSCLFYQVP